MDRSEYESDGGGNASLRVEASIGRSDKSVCADWDVLLKEDDSVKPVVDVKVSTDISNEDTLVVDDTFRVNVEAQHRHATDDGDAPTTNNQTSTAEAQQLKFGFYLPP